MKLSELIAYAQEMLAQHGDIEVTVAKASGYDYEVGYEAANCFTIDDNDTPKFFKDAEVPRGQKFAILE